VVGGQWPSIVDSNRAPKKNAAAAGILVCRLSAARGGRETRRQPAAACVTTFDFQVGLVAADGLSLEQALCPPVEGSMTGRYEHDPAEIGRSSDLPLPTLDLRKPASRVASGFT
jgi:hypothetical protein